MNAVIDVGSNSLRLFLYRDGKREKTLMTTQLIRGVSDRGFLAQDAARRSLDAYCALVARARLSGADRIYAFGTSALRGAPNAEEFLKPALEMTGVPVEVIGEDQEARYAFLGARGRCGGVGAVADLGGGSLEISVGNADALVSASVKLGAVRLKDECPYAAPLDRISQDRLTRHIEERMAGLSHLPGADSLIAVGGTATTLAAIELSLEYYDGDRVEGFVFSIESLESLINRLSRMDVGGLYRLPGLPRSRAGCIVGGALVLLMMMRMRGADRMRISDSDNLEGAYLARFGSG